MASGNENTLLLGAVEQHVLSRPGDQDRDMTQLHPSEISKTRWCHRLDFYRIMLPEQAQATEDYGAQLLRIFDEGHDIHAKWQRWLQEMGVLWGRWKCPRCENYVWGQSCDLEPCGVCGDFRWEYKEVPLRLRSHALIGHTDGVVILPDKPRLVEVKSIGMGTVRNMNSGLYRKYTSGELKLNDVWWRIQRPFAGHVRQGMTYLRMAQAWDMLMGSQTIPDIDEIIYFYEWKPNQAVREFVLRYSEALIKEQLDLAASVARALETGVAPDRPDWTEQREDDTPACRTCPYRNLCWSTHVRQAPAAPAIVVNRASAATRRRAASLVSGSA